MSYLFHMKLVFFCTDKGQHPRTVLGNVLIDDDGELIANHEIYSHGSIGDARKHQAVQIDYRGRVRIDCPRCKRNIPWKPETAERVITALFEQRIYELDISLIP